MQTQLTRALFSLIITSVLVGNSLRLAAEKKWRAEVRAAFSRDRDDIGRMFYCGSKRKRIFSSWPVLAFAFHERERGSSPRPSRLPGTTRTTRVTGHI